MSNNIKVVLQARNQSIADLTMSCAKKEITFEEYCEKIAAMGYKTTSCFEMVCAAEYELKQQK